MNVEYYNLDDNNNLDNNNNNLDDNNNLNTNNHRYNTKKFDKDCVNKEMTQNKNINDYILSSNPKYSCYQENPDIRNQKLGDLKNVDNETKLFGIDRKELCDDFHTCTGDICNTQKLEELDKEKEKDLNICNLNTVHSRFYNKQETTLNLREYGANRFETLKYDPQKNITIRNIVDTRNEIKDMYKPDLLKPEDHLNTVDFPKKNYEKKTTSVKIIN
tara:strand:- start:147 stop:797 length:651 start_codon:yes stop_codon:yes gene_type:complete